MNPKVTFTPDMHRYNFTEQQVEVLLDRFTEERGGGVKAEITITTDRQPGAGLLHRGMINLVTTRSRSDVIRALEQRPTDSNVSDVDFAGMLELVCFKSLNHWRDGDPVIDLREVQSGGRPQWLLEPYVDQATIVFGDGGTGKSLLLEMILASVASGHAIIGKLHVEPMPVMILDWETDEYVHAERLRAICAGAGIDVPPVYYRRQVASLVETTAKIRKEIARLGVGMVGIDSWGAARGADPDSAESTIRLFNAMRSLAVPWVGIDHVPKNDKRPNRPFGSTYTHNLARLTWGVTRAQEEGEDDIVIGLKNWKSNNGRLARRQGYRLRFEQGGDILKEITIDSCDLRDVPALAETLPAKDRILGVLRGGKMTVKEISEELKLTDATTRARLNDLHHKQKVANVGGEWGLMVLGDEGRQDPF